MINLKGEPLQFLVEIWPKENYPWSLHLLFRENDEHANEHLEESLYLEVIAQSNFDHAL
jgi:hypothetical protein